LPTVRATFAWQPVAGAAGYRLFRGTQQLASVSTVGYSLELDLPYGDHAFGIEAFNVSGFGPRSTVTRRLSEPPPPAPPPPPRPGAVLGFDVSLILLASPPSIPTESDPYDLSPYYALMEEALPGWSSDIGWPEQPDTSGGTVEVDTVAELRSAVAMSNRLVNIAPGTYDLAGTDLNISGNNLRFVASDGVTISGAEFNSDNATPAHHIWWTGGNILTTGLQVCTFRAVDDLMLEDVYMEAAVVLHMLSGTTGFNRTAIINSTIDSRALTSSAPHPIFIFQGNTTSAGPHEDLILANNKLIGGPIGGQYAIRVQNTKRVIVVESAHNMVDPSTVGVRGFRSTCNTQYMVVAGRAARPFYMIGNWNINYIGDSNEWDYAAGDSRWDYVRMYNNYTTPTAIASNISGNSGIVTNFVMYSETEVGETVTALSPLTSGSGYDSTIEDWDGTTLPDVSSYGAQR
jgi:hypothetical protein